MDKLTAGEAMQGIGVVLVMSIGGIGPDSFAAMFAALAGVLLGGACIAIGKAMDRGRP